MSWLTDKEQRNLLNEEPDQLQKIPPDIVQYIRDMVDQKISTGKISAKVSAKLREEWAHQIAWHEQKIDEHDHKIGDMDGFIAKIKRAFGGVVKG